MVKTVERGSYEDMQGGRVWIKGRKKGERVGRRAWRERVVRETVSDKG
jgi:hypothetical protein